MTRANIDSRSRPDVTRFLAWIDSEIRKATNRGESDIRWDGSGRRSPRPSEPEWTAIIEEIEAKRFLVGRHLNVEGFTAWIWIEW